MVGTWQWSGKETRTVENERAKSVWGKPLFSCNGFHKQKSWKETVEHFLKRCESQSASPVAAACANDFRNGQKVIFVWLPDRFETALLVVQPCAYLISGIDAVIRRLRVAEMTRDDLWSAAATAGTWWSIRFCSKRVFKSRRSNSISIFICWRTWATSFLRTWSIASAMKVQMSTSFFSERPSFSTTC